jgi:hypothetical protein
MADLKPTFMCFKWGQGYPCRYTNILFRALKDTMSRDFRFVCITDDETGLEDGIETRPIPPFKMDRADWTKGMWPKLAGFAPDLVEDGTPVLMLDVDIIVLRDLAPLFDILEKEGGLHIMRDVPDTLPRWFPRWFGKPLLSNSSVAGFIAGEQTHLYTEFKDKTYEELRPLRNDQNFIHYKAIGRKDWPTGWMLSFKKSHSFHFPVNLVRPIRRPDGYIVIFHGQPNPEDMAQRPFKRWGSPEKFGYFPVKWIKAYWQKYSRPSDY